MNKSNTILIIEDSEEDFHTTKRLLGKLTDCRIVGCSNAPSAMEFLGKLFRPGIKALPDFILLDLNMPGEDGRNLLARLKHDERFKENSGGHLNNFRQPDRSGVLLRQWCGGLHRKACRPGAVPQLTRKSGELLAQNSSASSHGCNFMSATGTGPSTASRSLDILIVDNCSEDIAGIRRQLRSHIGKFDTREACSGEQGLRECQLRKPDCVLLDMRMPEMDGLEFLTRAQIEGSLNFPVIVLTTFDDDHLAMRAIQLGAQDFLIKSQTAPELLCRTIDHACERFRTNRERESLIAKLSERTALLQEVHHRVKNNLAVISGLLALQADEVTDERARCALEESQQRVISMALIHEYLYANENLDRVHFGKYVAQLTEILSATYRVDSNMVAVRIEVENIELGDEPGDPLRSDPE